MDVCFVCVLRFQVEVSATSWSIVRRSPTDCGASLCVIKNLVNEEALSHCGGCRAKNLHKWMRSDPCGSAVEGMGLRIRIPPWAGCLSLCVFVLSGRCLCVGLITQPEESYRMRRKFMPQMDISGFLWPSVDHSFAGPFPLKAGRTGYCLYEPVSFVCGDVCSHFNSRYVAQRHWRISYNTTHLRRINFSC